MNNLLITIVGVFLLLGGVYAMSFGFSNPPNISLFLAGLCISVFGAIFSILFGSQIKSEKQEGAKPIKSPKKDIKAPKNAEIPRKVIKPKKSKIAEDSVKDKIIKPKSKEETLRLKKLVTSEKSKTPARNTKKDKKPIKAPVTEPKLPKKKKEETIPIKGESKEKKGISKLPTNEDPKKEKGRGKLIIPKRKEKELSEKKKDIIDTEPLDNKSSSKDKPITDTKPSDDKVSSKDKGAVDTKSLDKASEDNEIKSKPTKPQISITGKLKPMKPIKKDENTFVKDRLNRLKEDYIKNAEDIESLVEERLDSFKGTLNQIKSESKDPSIVWSFDAGDVQETMADTILKAENRILMMYPWIRNVDTTILKKFMETESRMIVQEASLDDDASVELIKLLMDNDVKIRTMPHVHTVAVVSDDSNGLIISTDPIYESFEVGVIYKDQKSIEEIERLFNEAWHLSKDIKLLK